MRYLRPAVLVVVAAALLAIPNVVHLKASDSDVVQEMKDRHDIEALMWKYARALDTFDADTYASVYTPDGQFGAGENATKGTAALKKMIVDLKANREKREQAGEKQPPMYHMEMNTFVEFPAKD